MSRRSMVRAVLAAAGMLGLVASSSAGAQEAITIDTSDLAANGCFGQADCAVDGADLSRASAGTLPREGPSTASPDLA